MKSESSPRRLPLAALATWLALGACEPGGASPIPQPTLLDPDDLTLSVPIVDGGHTLPTLDGRPGSAPARAVANQGHAQT